MSTSKIQVTLGLQSSALEVFRDLFNDNTVTNPELEPYMEVRHCGDKVLYLSPENAKLWDETFKK